MRIFFLFLFAFRLFLVNAQPDRWQQHINYVMDIDVDVVKFQYKGRQEITYTNNSPDTLFKVFYHLYFNAFQPGSMMHTRHSNMKDGDGRLVNIGKLSPEEQGWIKVKSLLHDGRPVKYLENETILEVTLDQPLLPGKITKFNMEWDAQVPKQTRRSGRSSAEGIEFSMAQWYPKLCEYDFQGWHPNPYIGREFYGVWGDFNVNITIDKTYIVAAGGILQNPLEIGYGYEEPGQKVTRPAGDKLTYRFVTKNVHDFAWAADPDYHHVRHKAQDGTEMAFFWQRGKGYDAQWEKLPAAMDRARTLMNERYGKYPYPYYAFIQGGDGGMEYPWATLITGNRPLNSLIGVSVHEQLHSWYQMILGTNESLYAWMDEGFTSYAETIVENELAKEGLMPGKEFEENPFEGLYDRFAGWITQQQIEEPLCIHADHANSNQAHSFGAYVKGQVCLRKIEYIIGKEAFDKGMLRYFETWKFKHPTANDFMRIMEKQSGLELDWFFHDWVNTLRHADYTVSSVERESRKVTEVTVTKTGEMAMPLDILVTFTDGKKEWYYAPLESMRGEKPQEDDLPRTILPDHRWTDPSFTFEIPSKLRKIEKIEIDPQRRMLDLNRDDNTFQKK